MTPNGLEYRKRLLADSETTKHRYPQCAASQSACSWQTGTRTAWPSGSGQKKNSGPSAASCGSWLTPSSGSTVKNSHDGRPLGMAKHRTSGRAHCLLAEGTGVTSDQHVPDIPHYLRCWCYRFGRCLTDCPTADLPKPVPMTDESWQRAYYAAIDNRYQDTSYESDKP